LEVITRMDIEQEKEKKDSNSGDTADDVDVDKI
jgi:hypothetical protein